MIKPTVIALFAASFIVNGRTSTGRVLWRKAVYYPLACLRNGYIPDVFDRKSRIPNVIDTAFCRFQVSDEKKTFLLTPEHM
jgi:hypothetical protein